LFGSGARRLGEERAEADQLKVLLAPYEEEMTCWPVSTRWRRAKQ
jgi:hypothetical protein